MSTIRAFLAGIGVAYLFDPEQGKRRRHVLRDRGLRAARRAVRSAGKRARYASGVAAGVLARVRERTVPDARSVDDATVLQRIRSEAFREVGVPLSDVDVDVREGVAVLRGAIESSSLAQDLVERVREVPGVHRVEDALEVRVG